MAFLIYRLHGIPWIGRFSEIFYVSLVPAFAFGLIGWNVLKGNRGLLLLGRYSYEIYLLHAALLWQVARMGLNPWLYLCVILGGTALLAPAGAWWGGFCRRHLAGAGAPIS